MEEIPMKKYLLIHLSDGRQHEEVLDEEGQKHTLEECATQFMNVFESGTHSFRLTNKIFYMAHVVTMEVIEK